jgi:high-affinity nickel-transport protein
MSLLLALAVGFVLGLRHATDADHIAAVATMLRAERGLRGALRTGVLWGLGHSATVLAAGAVVGLLGLRAPPWSTRACELGVAAMLVLVGLSSLRRSGARAAAPPSDARPVAVGLVHGLAGSAPLTLLALATVPTRARAMLYLLVFCAGTVAGMALLTAALAWPLSATARASERSYRALLTAAGLASVAMGAAVAREALVGVG